MIAKKIRSDTTLEEGTTSSNGSNEKVNNSDLEEEKLEVEEDPATLDQTQKRESKCQELRQKLLDMNWSKDQARSKLLGEQWFQGRTGYSYKTSKYEGDESD